MAGGTQSEAKRSLQLDPSLHLLIPRPEPSISSSTAPMLPSSLLMTPNLGQPSAEADVDVLPTPQRMLPTPTSLADLCRTLPQSSPDASFYSDKHLRRYPLPPSRSAGSFEASSPSLPSDLACGLASHPPGSGSNINFPSSNSFSRRRLTQPGRLGHHPYRDITSSSYQPKLDPSSPPRPHLRSEGSSTLVRSFAESSSARQSPRSLSVRLRPSSSITLYSPPDQTRLLPPIEALAPLSSTDCTSSVQLLPSLFGQPSCPSLSPRHRPHHYRSLPPPPLRSPTSSPARKPLSDPSLQGMLSPSTYINFSPTLPPST